MILLYIIGILCSLVLFAPSIVPAYVKWPIALLVALFIVFLFNLPKKDTIYASHENKKKIINHGLFNPLIMYLAASIYILGFTLIINHLQTLNITDFVAEFDKIIAAFEPNMSNNLFSGLIFVFLSIVIYYIRNGFKNNASESGLVFRSFWYIVFTLICLMIGIFNYDSFREFDIYAYLATGYNLYIYFGVVLLAILIDLLAKLIVHSHRRRKAKKAEMKALKEQGLLVEEETKVKKYKKPSFIGFLLKVLFVGLLYAGLYFGIPYLKPDFEFFGMYFGYALAGFLFLSVVGCTIKKSVKYRASINKSSKFLIFLHLVVLLPVYAVFAYYVYYFFGGYIKVIPYAYYIYVGVIGIVYLITVISLGCKAKKIRRNVQKESEVALQATPMTKKEAKLAKKQAKKEAKLVKKAARKANKYKKPSFIGFVLKVLFVGLLYAGLYFGIPYLKPDFEFFGMYFGYALAGFLFLSVVGCTIKKSVKYRASINKSSKFLIFLHLVVLLPVYAVFAYYVYYFFGGYIKVIPYAYYIYVGVIGIVYLITVISLGCKAKKIRRNVQKELEVALEATPMTKKEAKLAKKQAKLAKKEAKRAKKNEKKAKKLAKKEAKRAKVIAKERKRIEKKLAKKEAKINKKISKIEKIKTKKLIKFARKAQKKAEKSAKKNK